MCGRYYNRRQKQEIAEQLRAKKVFGAPYAPNYNVAPTTFQPIARQERDTDDRELILARYTGKLANRPLSRTDVWYMVRRRAIDAQLKTAIGCHTFRATGITDYLTNGASSKSRSVWLATQMPKPQVYMTGAMMTSVSTRWRG